MKQRSLSNIKQEQARGSIKVPAFPQPAKMLPFLPANERTPNILSPEHFAEAPYESADYRNQPETPSHRFTDATFLNDQIKALQSQLTHLKLTSCPDDCHTLLKEAHHTRITLVSDRQQLITQHLAQVKLLQEELHNQREENALLAKQHIDSQMSYQSQLLDLQAKVAKAEKEHANRVAQMEQSRINGARSYDAKIQKVVNEVQEWKGKHSDEKQARERLQRENSEIKARLEEMSEVEDTYRQMVKMRDRDYEAHTKMKEICTSMVYYNAQNVEKNKAINDEVQELRQALKEQEAINFTLRMQLESFQSQSYLPLAGDSLDEKLAKIVNIHPKRVRLLALVQRVMTGVYRFGSTTFEVETIGKGNKQLIIKNSSGQIETVQEYLTKQLSKVVQHGSVSLSQRESIIEDNLTRSSTNGVNTETKKKLGPLISRNNLLQLQ
ncbi:hypothetical protein FGO68_gene10772 [Halteria grandinella]|uniref:Uncharacterized protein n=1 Tax=Halteria grandinella TaxID=5974 RepID=A0A8J8NP84_HALGN|nr:hypothetical protein FGO68_gene10772 [Halteria grandinella]